MIATMSSELTYELEDALVFVFDKLMNGRNTKPVVMHSLRVMFRLWNYGYTNRELLLAAILHDAIEDSEISALEIQRHFGEEVARIVKSVTFDSTIPYGKLRHQEMFKRVVQGGKWPILLKCADTLDNSAYYYLCENREKEIYLAKKMKDFLDISKDYIEKENVWRDLKERYQNELLRLGIKNL